MLTKHKNFYKVHKKYVIYENHQSLCNVKYLISQQVQYIPYNKRSAHNTTFSKKFNDFFIPLLQKC